MPQKATSDGLRTSTAKRRWHAASSSFGPQRAANSAKAAASSNAIAGAPSTAISSPRASMAPASSACARRTTAGSARASSAVAVRRVHRPEPKKKGEGLRKQNRRVGGRRRAEARHVGAERAARQREQVLVRRQDCAVGELDVDVGHREQRLGHVRGRVGEGGLGGRPRGGVRGVRGQGGARRRAALLLGAHLASLPSGCSREEAKVRLQSGAGTPRAPARADTLILLRPLPPPPARPPLEGAHRWSAVVDADDPFILINETIYSPSAALTRAGTGARPWRPG